MVPVCSSISSIIINIKYVQYSNGTRRRTSSAEPQWDSEEQREKSISTQSYYPSLTAGIKLLQSVCVFLSTQSGMTAIPTVKAQRHKDLMEYIDSAHAAWGSVGVVGFLTQPKLLKQPSGVNGWYNPLWKRLFTFSPGRHGFAICGRTALTLVGIRLRFWETCLTHNLYS